MSFSILNFAQLILPYPLLFHALRHMAVNIQRESGSCMSNGLLNCLYFIAVLKGQHGEGVPQIVEAGSGRPIEATNFLKMAYSVRLDRGRPSGSVNTRSRLLRHASQAFKRLSLKVYGISSKAEEHPAASP